MGMRKIDTDMNTRCRYEHSRMFSPYNLQQYFTKYLVGSQHPNNTSARSWKKDSKGRRSPEGHEVV